MKDEDLQMLFFKTIANKTRFKIVKSLEGKPKSVNELVKDTGYEQTLVSHNLKVLKENGFVEVKQDGKYRYYNLDKENVAPMMNAIERHVQKQKKHEQ